MAPDDQPTRPDSKQSQPAAQQSAEETLTDAHLESPTPVTATTPTRPTPQPPKKHGQIGTWLTLIVCLLLPLPAMLIEYHRPDVFDPGEMITVTTSIHSWDHQAKVALKRQFSFERLAPYYNDLPQWHRSPLITWLHQLSFAAVDSEDVTIDQLITAARTVSIISAIVALACLYWAGTSLGGRQTGLLATFICAANPVFLYYARNACDIMPATAFIMLAIATALWAVRPLRPMPSFPRQLLGWVICGLATGAAMLAIGPIAILLIIIPVLVIDLICPDRFSHLMGLLAALLIGSLVVLPAAAIALQYDNNAWWAWMQSLAPFNPQSPQQIAAHILSRSGLLLLALIPWTIWFIAAICQPFSASSTGSRRRLFLSWSLFISTAILMVFLKGPNLTGYAISMIVPLLAPGSLLIGELFAQYIHLAGEGRFPRSWRVLRWPQMIIVLVLSIATGIVLHQPSVLQAIFTLERQPMINMGWVYAASVAAGLFAIALLSCRFAAKQYPGRTLIAWATWVLVLVPAIALPLARGSVAINPIRSEAEDLVKRINVQQVLWLDVDSQYSQYSLDPAFLLYSRRGYSKITLDQIPQTAQQHGRFLLLGPDHVSPKSTQLKRIARYPNSKLLLWQVEPASESQTIKNDSQ